MNISNLESQAHSKQSLRESAQDSCLRGIANVLLGELETYGEPNWQLIREIAKQGQRVMRLFKVDGYHGIPDLGSDLDEWLAAQKGKNTKEE